MAWGNRNCKGKMDALFPPTNLLDTFDMIVNWLCRVKVSSGELLEDKLENQILQKGLLLEFKKDSDRVLLAVAQRPDGKKNWMVYDQVLVETPNAAFSLGC